MTKNWTYMADHDDLSVLDDNEKIEWMEGRVKKILLDPVRKFINDKTNNDLALGVVTWICCAIDALGGFLDGDFERKRDGLVGRVLRFPFHKRTEGGSRQGFRKFVESYLEDIEPIKTKIYDEFRSGLSHGMVIKRGSVDGKLNNLYEERERGQKIYYEVNPWLLFEKLETASENYFKDLKKKGNIDLRKKFLGQFDQSYKFWINNPPKSKK